MSSSLYLIFTIIATSVGQILLKKGMSIAGQLPSRPSEIIVFLTKNMIFNPYVLSGLLLAILSTMGWMATLSKLKLSFAYPFMSVAFPIVLILSGIIFGETIPLSRWIGMTIIIVGLVVVSRS